MVWSRMSKRSTRSYAIPTNKGWRKGSFNQRNCSRRRRSSLSRSSAGNSGNIQAYETDLWKNGIVARCHNRDGGSRFRGGPGYESDSKGGKDTQYELYYVPRSPK